MTDGQPQIEVMFGEKTVWLSLVINWLTFLAETSMRSIDKHVSNVFFEGELVKSAVVATVATTAADGKYISGSL